ncbi:MAG: hypothetical protein AB2L14_28335 [Candidatus Xenobiia bacterium LiM19]
MKKADADRIFLKLSLNIRSTSHCYGWLVVNNRKILRVHYSHGKGDIPERVTQKIRGQLKLTLHDFRALIDCSLTREDYLEILKSKNLVENKEIPQEHSSDSL